MFAVALLSLLTATASPEPGSAPHTIPEAEVAAPTGPELHLVSPPVLSLGGLATVELVNRGDMDWVLHHRGGSNGCAAFHWNIRLVSPDGVTFHTRPVGPRVLCTMAIVPPSDIVIRAGERLAVQVPMHRVFYRHDPADPWADAQAVPLPAGTYTLHVGALTATVQVS